MTTTLAPYRDATLAAEVAELRRENERLRKIVATVEGMVPFGGACPACGENDRVTWRMTGYGSAERVFFPRRWWRPVPYFGVECHCGCKFREALKDPQP